MGYACSGYSLSFKSFPDVGSWRTPNHKTPETVGLTEPTACPILGISGLLNLLTWVERQQQAQASLQKEGGARCPIPHSIQSPPVRLQASDCPVDEAAPGQSSAASLVAKPLARTSVGSKSAPKQGGR
jgi:hypothetical protein